jgi:hypothetical protein
LYALVRSTFFFAEEEICLFKLSIKRAVMLSVLRSAGVLNRSSLLVKHHAAALAALNAKCQPIRDQVSPTLTSTTNQVRIF